MSIYFFELFLLLLRINITIIVKIEDFEKRFRYNFRLSKQAKDGKFSIREKYLKILNIRSTHFFFPTWTSIPSNESIKVSGSSRYFKLWPLPYFTLAILRSFACIWNYRDSQQYPCIIPSVGTVMSRWN